MVGGVAEDAYNELLDAFGAESLAEVERLVAFAETRGDDPRDGDWEWNHAAEFYLHEFNPFQLKDDLRAYLDARSTKFPEVDFYREHGSFRDTTPLDADEQDIVDARIFDVEPQQCYKNTQLNVGSPLTYVEGYITTPQHPRPTPHAWLELDGKVAEITPPNTGSEEAVYYGVAYEASTVRRAITDRERADPLVEDRDAYSPKRAAGSDDAT